MKINNGAVQKINASVQAIIHLSSSYKHRNPRLSHELDEIADNITDALCDVYDV